MAGTSLSETPEAPKHWMNVLGAMGNDVNKDLYAFHLTILGYSPDNAAKRCLPDCLLPFLGPEASLTYEDDRDVLIVRRTGPNHQLKDVCGAFNALKKNGLGYFANFYLLQTHWTPRPAHIQTWLSSPGGTPKVAGGDEVVRNLILQLTKGEVATQSPFGDYGFLSWTLETDAAFVRYHNIHDLDLLLGG